MATKKLTPEERRAKHAAYMREYYRRPASVAYLEKTKEQRAARVSAWRVANYEDRHAKDKAYQTSPAGLRNSASRQERWRKAHPEAYRAARVRYYASDKGKIYKWSNSASARVWKAGGSLSAKQLRELWYQQGGTCVLTGRKMLPVNGSSHLDSPSIDRIEASKGYVMSNVRLVTLQANCAKLFGTDDQLIAFCRDVIASTLT